MNRHVSLRAWDWLVGVTALYVCATNIAALAFFWRAPLAMMLLAATGWVALAAVWFRMLADAIRRQFESHSTLAKLWHAVLLIMPLAAFVYYFLEWRPRARRTADRGGAKS